MNLAEQMRERTVKSYETILRQTKEAIIIDIKYAADNAKTCTTFNPGSAVWSDIMDWLLEEGFKVTNNGTGATIKIEW